MVPLGGPSKARNKEGRKDDSLDNNKGEPGIVVTDESQARASSILVTIQKASWLNE